MIFTVTFSGLTQNGSIKRVGAIIWNDQKKGPPKASRKSNILDNVLARAIRTEDGLVFADKEPRKFMTNLSLVYRAPQLYATKAIQSG
jgi:hypothetical protein